ncbi:MAG: Xaa-Pro peptidase family protein [bacterium]
MKHNTSRPARDLPSSEFLARITRLLAYQKGQRLDALLLFTEINRYYFTGLTTSNGLLLTHNDSGPAFYTDFRYLAMAKRSTPWLPCRTLWRPADEPKAFGKLGKSWKRVGYEGQLDTARFLRLKATLPQVEWVDISTPVAEFRSVKSRAEQQVLRAAVAANDHLFAAVLRGITPGLSEWEIRALVRREADRLGQGEAFDTIACVGKNGAECHHHPDATILKRGQPLLLDLGLKLDRYCSDMTRCVFFGTPTPFYRDLHKIVREANLKAVRAIKPGVPCCDIDALARRHIEKAGYGTCFGHGLGHAVGLEIHEAPNFSSACKTVLKPGMVLTVEPGIYLPGKTGIRIEDVVLVTRNGCEVLSQTPRWLTR